MKILCFLAEQYGILLEPYRSGHPTHIDGQPNTNAITKSKLTPTIIPPTTTNTTNTTNTNTNTNTTNNITNTTTTNTTTTTNPPIIPFSNNYTPTTEKLFEALQSTPVVNAMVDTINQLNPDARVTHDGLLEDLQKAHQEAMFSTSQPQPRSKRRKPDEY